MLNTQAELSQDIVRQIARRLGDEIHPDALGTNQPHHLLQALLQRLGRTLKEQVRLVEEQRQYRFVGVTALRQLFEQFGQQPQQEGCIHLGRLMNQAGGIEQVHAPATIAIRV